MKENEKKRKKKKKKKKKKIREEAAVKRRRWCRWQVDSRSAVQWTVYFALRPVSPVIPGIPRGLTHSFSLARRGTKTDHGALFFFLFLFVVAAPRSSSSVSYHHEGKCHYHNQKNRKTNHIQ